MKNDDKVVAKIFETYEYEKFSILAENRGQKETKGLKDRKLKTLQNMIDRGEWIHELSRVCVNEKFEIVDGAHTLEIARRNSFPVRYEIVSDPHFNDVSKRDLIGSVYIINSVSTVWTSSELFGAAVQTKAPLALVLNEIIEAHENFFVWTDLMALLQKDDRYFTGRWRHLANMQTFESKELVELAKSEEFALEVKHFAKLNLKARIAPRKGIIFKAAYDILWHCRDMVNPALFRRALTSLPENLVTSVRSASDEPCRRMLIQHYNKTQGAAVDTAAVIYALKHKDQEVIEIT